jgi:hypothetical protein
MGMAAMNMVSAVGFRGVSFHLRRCPQGVVSVLRKKTPIFGSRQSKLGHLTVIRRNGCWRMTRDKNHIMTCSSSVFSTTVLWISYPVLIIDYRCEDGRFLVSASCVKIANPNSLFSCETGINPGIRSWKSTHLNELNVRKPSTGFISQKSEELRLNNLV